MANDPAYTTETALGDLRRISSEIAEYVAITDNDTAQGWMADLNAAVEHLDGQHVFVHIWDDNANVYDNADAALNGIAENYDELSTADVAEALATAAINPGEPAYLDGGMSCVRWMSVTP